MILFFVKIIRTISRLKFILGTSTKYISLNEEIKDSIFERPLLLNTVPVGWYSKHVSPKNSFFLMLYTQEHLLHILLHIVSSKSTAAKVQEKFKIMF